MNLLKHLALAASVAAPLALAPAAAAGPQAEGSNQTAQEPERKARDVSHFNLGKQSLAISGYDPVAYFPEGGGKPLKGLAKHEHVHEGVRYRFATEKHLELFKQQPSKYEPAYGGWCAFAMSGGDKVEIDPKSFHVGDGKLLLFYKSFFNDTRKKWLKEPAVLAPKADKAWSSILKTKKK